MRVGHSGADAVARRTHESDRFANPALLRCCRASADADAAAGRHGLGPAEVYADMRRSNTHVDVSFGDGSPPVVRYTSGEAVYKQIPVLHLIWMDHSRAA